MAVENNDDQKERIKNIHVYIYSRWVAMNFESVAESDKFVSAYSPFNKTGFVSPQKKKIGSSRTYRLRTKKGSANFLRPWCYSPIFANLNSPPMWSKSKFTTEETVYQHNVLLLELWSSQIPASVHLNYRADSDNKRHPTRDLRLRDTTHVTRQIVTRVPGVITEQSVLRFGRVTYQ